MVSKYNKVTKRHALEPFPVQTAELVFLSPKTNLEMRKMSITKLKNGLNLERDDVLHIKVILLEFLKPFFYIFVSV